MKNCIVNLDSKINHSFSLIYNKKQVITEQQILELQDLFLTNGIHYLYVSSFEEGRTLIYDFLNALRCHTHVACATNYGHTLPSTIFDLQSYLDSFDFFNNQNVHEFQNFLNEEFDFDFVWIEQNSSYHNGRVLEQTLVTMALDQRLPIFIISIKE